MFRIFLTLAIIIITGCATGPREQYSDNIFTYLDNEGNKAFSFVLTLDNFSQEFLTREQRAAMTNGKAPQRSKKSTPRPENPEDIGVSLKFRMEEIAFVRMERKLRLLDYCPEGHLVSETDFERNKYKIKGKCN